MREKEEEEKVSSSHGEGEKVKINREGRGKGGEDKFNEREPQVERETRRKEGYYRKEPLEHSFLK